jgi:hypothetical protein
MSDAVYSASADAVPPTIAKAAEAAIHARTRVGFAAERYCQEFLAARTSVAIAYSVGSLSPDQRSASEYADRNHHDWMHPQQKRVGRQ